MTPFRALFIEQTVEPADRARRLLPTRVSSSRLCAGGRRVGRCLKTLGFYSSG